MSGGSGRQVPPECRVEEVLKPAEIVLQEDLESLRRTYSEEERVEFWNMVRKAYKDFILKCSTELPQDLVKLVKGKYRLAMLLLAASFKLNGEGQDDIIGMFREEEYRILQDFEEFKVFDSLDIDAIVEFIKRREGRVYELVRRYYERQYNMLDRSWGPLMGDLAAAFEARYRARRRKIEEAVVRYVRRYGLLETVSEIEDAVRRALKAGELRREAEEVVRRVEREYAGGVGKLVEELERRLSEIYGRVKELEEAIPARRGLEGVEGVRSELKGVEEVYEGLRGRLEGLLSSVKEVREGLKAEVRELEGLAGRAGRAEAAEVLKAEALAARKALESLERLELECRRLLSVVEGEGRAVKEVLKDIEEFVRGGREGHLLTLDEAEALAEAYLGRVALKLRSSGEPGIYDPRYGRVRRVGGWVIRRYSDPSGDHVGVEAVCMRGLLRRRRDVVVDAVVRLHRARYSSRGFDSKPVTLAELLEEVRGRVRDAEEGGYYAIIVVASPTGFTKGAREYVAGGGSPCTLASGNATVYLVDLTTGEVFRRPSDEAAARNEWVVRPELPEELVRRVVDYVLSEDALAAATASSPSSPALRVGDVVRGSGVRDPAVVRAALARLEALGYGKVVEVGGEEVFRYSRRALGGGRP